MLLIGTTLVLLFTALFSGQMASYSGGVCVPGTATSTASISTTTTVVFFGRCLLLPGIRKRQQRSRGGALHRGPSLRQPGHLVRCGHATAGAAVLGSCLSQWLRLLG